MKDVFFKVRNRFLRSYGNDIDYSTLMRMMKNNSNILVIDVRTKDEFRCGHINGAINVPLQDIKEKIGNVVKDKNKVIIVYCQYGGRSRKACIKLEKMGYTNVYNLKDGLDGI